MTGKAGTLETIARQIGLAFQPLQEKLAPANVLEFFAELGLQFPPQLLQANVVTALNNGISAAGALPNTITQLSTAIDNDNEGAILQAGTQLVQEIGSVIVRFEQIGIELDNISGTLPGMNAAEVATFAQNLSSQLLSYLLISYLETIQSGVVGIGNLLGVLDYIPNPGVPGDPTHPPYIARKLQLSRLGDLFTKPDNLLKDLYEWGDSTFDGTSLISRLSTSLNLLGVPAQVLPGAPLQVDSSLLLAQINPASNPPGVSATLKTTVPGGLDLTLPLGGAWSVHILTTGTVSDGLQATVVPPANVTLHPAVALNVQLKSDLFADGTDAAHPIVILGQTGGSRFTTDSFTFGMGLTVTWDSASNSAVAEPLIGVEITNGRVVIDLSDADGFLATVLSGIRVEAGFDLKVSWAPDIGIHIDGGAQLEIDLPLHLSFGPVTLTTLYLVAEAGSSGIPVQISAGLGLALGPIQVAVDRVGVKGLIAFPDDGGNLGPIDVSVAFKPPNGLGIAIDAGVVAGGGYIQFNPDKGQYVGVLDVSLAEIIQVKVIGVLDTVLPSGTVGFSFLLIITFDFPPIQLGLGFTLNRVGGLGGVDRTMNTDALHAGFRAHTLDSILFPPDPIANAPQIISDIENFFPPAEGRYVFGPMLEVAWGTPTLATFSVGVILEVPDPVRIVLLGLIDAGLPSTDIALIELHIDVLGILDFGVKTLSIDGSLYDSHILIYSVAGDLVFRYTWGNDPNLIFSLGGFNPHFNTTGLDVPNLHRLSVSIGHGDNPRISANSYYAITSNTVQFGANVEAYAEAAGFAIHGYLGFDILFIRSPFSFEFDFSAGFDVSFEGVGLFGLNVSGTFSGPRPWHINGEACLDILFFSICGSVNRSWGDSTPAILPQKPVLPDLTAALQDPRNWNTTLPDGTTQAVTLTTSQLGDTTLRVHPIGTLNVRESVVPLDLQITLYGNATPADGTYFSISDVKIDGHEENRQAFQDYFAAAQFLALSDADKVSRPSFEKYDAGVTIGSAEMLAGADSPRTVVYEERYIDEPSGFSGRAGLYAMPAHIHLALTRQGAGFASPLKNTGLAKYATGVSGPAIKTQDPSYVVAHVEDLSVRSDIISAGGSTYFQARAALESYVALHPEEESNLQILALHEVAA